MNKFWIVLQREYLTKVGKKSFIILTLLMPLLMVAMVLIPMLLGKGARDTSEKEVLVFDATDKYYDVIASGENGEGFVFRRGTGTLESYRSGEESAHYAYVVITEDLLENPRALTIYTHRSIPPALGEYLQSSLESELREEKIASFDIPNLDQIIKDTRVRINPSTVQWSKDGEEKESSALVAMVAGQLFSFLLFMFVIIYGSMVMTSVQEEKKNRIVEIIASSVKPTTLLFAKMVAIGLVGLTQVGIWAIFLVLAFVVVQSIFIGNVTMDMSQLSANMTAAGDFDPEMIQSLIMPLSNFDFGGMFVAFIFYFICAYFSFASVYAALGAAMDSDEDVSQMAMPVSLLMMFGLYAAIYSVENPSGPLALWGSFIPFIAPNVMMVRLPFDPPTWQIALSSIVMILTTYALVWCSAKVFRVGLLMYGKKPSLKEMARWIRYK